MSAHCDHCGRDLSYALPCTACALAENPPHPPAPEVQAISKEPQTVGDESCARCRDQKVLFVGWGELSPFVPCPVCQEEPHE